MLFFVLGILNLFLVFIMVEIDEEYGRVIRVLTSILLSSTVILYHLVRKMIYIYINLDEHYGEGIKRCTAVIFARTLVKDVTDDIRKFRAFFERFNFITYVDKTYYVELGQEGSQLMVPSDGDIMEFRKREGIESWVEIERSYASTDHFMDFIDNFVRRRG